MNTIKQVLMERDGMDEEEADELIAEAQMALDGYLNEGDREAAYNVCQEFFGLEPDYLMELIEI